MSFVIGAVEKVHIVCGDDGEGELFGECDELGEDGLLRFEAVVVEFDEGVVLTEDVAEFC